MERQVDIAIIGAGSAGLAALSRIRQGGKSFVLINGGELGTTCARVGCMPSKAAIQVAERFHHRHHFARIGIEGREALRLDAGEAMEHVRDLRDIFVDRVLASSTDDMGDEFLEGYARFLEPTVLSVDDHIIRANKVIIASGSRPYVPRAWDAFKDRILTTDNFFEQQTLPESLAVIGLGSIGLEMGQCLYRMGVKVTGIDQLDTIGGLQDPAVAKVAIEVIGKEFPLWLGNPAEVQQEDGTLRVRSGERELIVEAVFASLGRVPNVEHMGLENLGVDLDARGVPAFDPHTMQVGDLPVFIAGDVTGGDAVLHEATHEGRIAGYNAAQDKVTAFRRNPPFAITFCDPNVATIGASWRELHPNATAVGEIRFGPVGRALIMGRNKGMLRVYGDRTSGEILGASMVAPRGEHLAHLLAWTIRQGLTVFDLLKMPYYHPTIEEALQAALDSLQSQLDTQPIAPAGLDPLEH